MTVRVLLAEDQAMVRGALSALLSLEEDIEIVAEASRGDEVLPAALDAFPDVALLDIEMPGGDGLSAAARLKERLPACRVIILTTFGRAGYLKRAMEAGALGFMLKDAPATELASAIRRVAVGERVVDPGLAAAALSEGGSPLTEREREVLSASADGATIGDVASKLYLSEGTVRNYLSIAIKKLGVRNRVEAARLAERKGWRACEAHGLPRGAASHLRPRQTGRRTFTRRTQTHRTKETHMSTVVMHNVVSVDGFIADHNDDVGPLFDWYFNGDTPLIPGEMDDPSPGGMKISKTSYDYVWPTWDAIGSMVIGRHLFDMTNGWEGKPPTGDHVVVVSHRPKPDGWHPEASYHFVDDVAQAIAKAKELAGEGTVAVAAGDVGGQALALGLVDEVAMDVVPVVFGSGKRYFGSFDGQCLLEDPDVVIRGDRVLHLRYRVRR